MSTNYPRIILDVLLTLALSGAVFAQTKDAEFVGGVTTEFTYQGRLTDNNATANGNYDFEFKLTDANGIVLATQQKLNVAVTNGIFTVRLDYGSAPFNNPSSRFLEIGVRLAGTAAFTTLSPRQPITAAPYAIASSTAFSAQFANFTTDSQKLGGVDANQYILTTDSRLSDSRNPLPGSVDYIQNSTNEQNADFTINGVGSAGILKAVNVNALFQYSLNGAKFITAPGTNNTFLGIGSGANWTTGAGNSFFGRNSGQNTADGAGNSFFGTNAGMQNTSGLQNSYFGMSAGLANQTGSYNSFFGALAGTSVTGGNGNAFFGSEAGQNTTNGSDNAIFGRGAGGANMTGNNNAYFGSYSGRLGSDVSFNAFFGAYAGNNNNGSSNSFFGESAGFSNTSGQSNTFLGRNSGLSNTQGNANVFVGITAGSQNTTGNNNAFFGAIAGNANVGGNENTFVGSTSGKDNSSGSKNTFVGSFAGTGNVSGNNNTALGESATVFNNLSYATAIGSGAIVSSSNTILLGRQSGDDQIQIPGRASISGKVTISTLGSAGGSSLCRNGLNEIAACSSSIRYKTDVENFSSGLDLIKKLRPVSFTWKFNGERDLGFVAEEVAAVEPLLTTTNEKGEIEGVKYDRISTALVNAIGEQQTQIEAQNEQIKRQQTVIENQQRQLKTQQEQIEVLKKLICASNAQAEICREKE